MKNHKFTWLEKVIDNIKHHPVYILISIPIIVVIVIGNFTSSIESIKNFIKEDILVNASQAHRTQNETPRTSARSMATTAASDEQSPVGPTPQEVFQTLGNKTLTDLQRVQFIHRTDGAAVQWSGTVRDVNPQTDNRILVVFALNYDSERLFPDIVVAIFPKSLERDLSALSPGDHVVIAGRLGYINQIDPQPILNDCTLITFSHNGDTREKSSGE